MSSFDYRFDHASPAALSVARRRGILAPGERLLDGFERAAAALAPTSDQHAFRADLLAALTAGRLGLSSQLFTAAGRSDRVGACTVLAVPAGEDAARLRGLIASASQASAAGLGCG